MPDSDGKLSHDEILACNTRFEEFETKMGHDLTCEVCGGIAWVLLDHVLQIPVDSPAGVISARRRWPTLVYTCSVCGNAKFFPAPRWGIEAVPPRTRPSQPSSDSGEDTDGN